MLESTAWPSPPFQALLRVTVDVDACSDYGFYDNDVCLEDMVADLDRASASGAFVQALKYWADQLNVDMSPFIRARGVEESEWASVPDEDDSSGGGKKKKSDDLPYGAYVFLVLVAVLIGLCCLAALAWYLYQACRDCSCSCRNPCRRGVKNMGKGPAPRDYQPPPQHLELPAQKREAEETKMAAEPVEVEAPPPPVYEEPPPPSYDDRWRYGESFDAYDRRRPEPETFRPRRTPSPAVVVKEPPKIMATPVPEDPLPTSPYARAAASSAAARRKLAATPRREDYDELHAEREAFERHVRSLMAKKAQKDAARAAVALAAHERTVERASRRKAEIDARRGLAARTAERRQRRSASTSPAPDLAARTARRRAASTSPARRAAPDDLAARTAERRRRTGR